MNKMNQENKMNTKNTMIKVKVYNMNHGSQNGIR